MILRHAGADARCDESSCQAKPIEDWVGAKLGILAQEDASSFCGLCVPRATGLSRATWLQVLLAAAERMLAL